MNPDNALADVQVIIVDDDQLVRSFAVNTIEYGTNRKVTTFENGFHAWQFIQSRPDEVDIIIADANIPDMDGLELLGQVKGKHPKKKFVLTTSHPEIENTALQLGADAFLLKPYCIDDLFILIEQLFASSHPDSDLRLAQT